ncbi:MAG: tRNA dihydrouridine synthase DusB [Candidatus Marinimicrobia bacterium]|nr:tRNA dihydrouridine synthase DusB [Candidatus Neomarinimicrobiota bacterium]
MSKSLKISNLQIDTPILLAPMAGVTDYSFRILCKEQGAGIVYSEFVSAHGIIRGNDKTLDLIKFNEDERPIGVQIFGDLPLVMADAAKFVVEKFKPDILDINYGCPVPKVTKKGAGSAALKDLELMDEITRAVVESVPQVPVTVKMRAGWDLQSIIVEKAGVLLENTGISAITLHPRTTMQTLKGNANWSLIKLLKETVSVPVIGNGDIKTADDVLQMFDETGCDAVMIGRAALGNPWFFNQAWALLQGKTVADPSVEDRVKLCKRHFELILNSRGRHRGLYLMRKHFGWYIKGFPGAADYRTRLVTAKSIEIAKNILNEITK